MRLIASTLVLAIVGGFALAANALTAMAAGGQAIAAIEPLLNTVDGSEIRGCIERGELDPRRPYQAWIAFGVVKSQAGGWDPVASRIDCGSGLFDKTGSEITRTFGPPYLVVDIETVLSVAASGKAETRLRVRKLKGFDPAGRPDYVVTATTRQIELDSQRGAIFPLLVSSARERDAFGLRELFLRLSARASQPPASYGALSVTADVPGIPIFLDGGVIGRTKEGAPSLFANVLPGTRQLRVRDLSGRESNRAVTVAIGRTTNVAFELLSLSDASGTELHSIGKNAEGHDEYWRRRDGAIVVNVPAGDFLMGSPEGKGEANERPQRQIDVSRFLIDKTEVTWRQFRKFAAATAAKVPPAPLWGTPDDYAVVNVLWSEAQAFCEWVGGGLPTEAQWEKAARGTDGRQYPWGNEWDRDRCNSIDGGPHRPEPAGAFANCTSPYGVVDMAGSVWEWTADWYGDRYPSDGVGRDPRGPESGTMRVLRGAAWLNQPIWLRTAYRSRNDPAARNVNYGFRCAQPPPD